MEKGEGERESKRDFFMCISMFDLNCERKEALSQDEMLLNNFTLIFPSPPIQVVSENPFWKSAFVKYCWLLLYNAAHGKFNSLSRYSVQRINELFCCMFHYETFFYMILNNQQMKILFGAGGGRLNGKRASERAGALPSYFITEYLFLYLFQLHSSLLATQNDVNVVDTFHPLSNEIIKKRELKDQQMKCWNVIKERLLLFDINQQIRWVTLKMIFPLKSFPDEKSQEISSLKINPS